MAIHNIFGVRRLTTFVFVTTTVFMKNAAAPATSYQLTLQEPAGIETIHFDVVGEVCLWASNDEDGSFSADHAAKCIETLKAAAWKATWSFPESVAA